MGKLKHDLRGSSRASEFVPTDHIPFRNEFTMQTTEPYTYQFASTDEQAPAQATSNDCCVPEKQDELSHDDPPAKPSHDPSPGKFDEISLTAVDWEDSCTPTWTASWDNTTTGWGAGEVFQPGEYQRENWRSSKLRPESKSWLHSLCFGVPAHTMSDKEFQDLMDLHNLPLATRLEDDDWLDSELGNVLIDDELLFRLLTRGRELAQKCFWSFMDKNQPEIRQREFPGGWQQVKLEGLILDDMLEPFCLSFRQNDSALARNALFAVVQLRNLTCHWNRDGLGWSRPVARTVDLHLKNVQKLAIHFYDEERAAEARKLRDEARQAVEDTVSEMEELEPLFDVYPWKYHHARMFEQIEYAKYENTPEVLKYPDVILRAVEIWSRHHSSSDQTFAEEPTNHEDANPGDDRLDKGEEDHADPGKETADTATIAKAVFVTRVPSRRHSVTSRETPSPSSVTERQRVVRRNSDIL